MADLLSLGGGWHDATLLLLRLALGTFFILARFRWVWDPSQQITCASTPSPRWFPQQRQISLTNKLYHCGYGTNPILSGIVASVELLAAAGVLFGALTALSAVGLMGVLVFATICTAKEKVARQNPIDCVDWACCYLWLVEPLYLIMALGVALAGPGRYSFDALLFSPQREVSSMDILIWIGFMSIWFGFLGWIVDRARIRS